MNSALVKEDDLNYDFHDAKRNFLALNGAQSTEIEIPLVAALKDGELAVVLTWHEGSKISGNNVEVQALDLHVEFQPTETIKCTVDRFSRDCNGVKLTADQYYSMGAVSHIQAAKLDYLGDFDYMVYASRSKVVEAKTAASKNIQIEAILQVFSPHHKQAVYEVSLPFYNADVQEKYWIGFCLRGGQGINVNGVSVSDPNSLFLNRPDVNQQCILDKEHISTIAVPQPQSVNTRVISNDYTELTWSEAANKDIARYRIFVSEKDVSGSTLNFETPTANSTYKLRTPKSMWGKDYLVSIQAIDKNHKLSPVSEPAVFKVSNGTTVASGSSSSTTAAGPSLLPSPITRIQIVQATYDKITLAWPEVSDAADYKVKWDKGDQQTASLYYDLVSSTG
jgi:hypothetical protein